MRILYFAWVRERIGRDGETVSPPIGVDTVEALLDWLEQDDAARRAALADRGRLRAAVDGRFVAMDAPIAGAIEIAIFPPVTGG